MNWLTRWLSMSESKLLRLAEQLALECQEQVWKRVAPQAASMTPAEARGYIRAISHRIVKEQVASAAVHSQQNAATGQRLLGLATEQVIRLVGIQLRAVRSVQKTARRAA